MITAPQRVPTASMLPLAQKAAVEHIVALPRSSAMGSIRIDWRLAFLRDTMWTLPSLQALAATGSNGC